MEEGLFDQVDLTSVYKRRRFVNYLMLGLSGAATLLAVIPLVWITVYVLYKGSTYINLDFFIHFPKPMGMPGGGVLHAIEGTLVMVLIASVISIPLALLAANYLLLFPKHILSSAVRFSTDLLSGVPSIVIGLFGYAVIVVTQKHYSAFAGGIVLAIIMLPVMLRATEEMLKLVPKELREGALALGSPEWKAAISVVLPASMEGIITGIMLAIARAIGETAPLLFTALGNDNFDIGHYIKQGITYHQSVWGILMQIINQPTDALPLTLWKYAQQPYAERVQQSWAVAMVLMLFVLLLNILARLWLSYRQKRMFAK